MTNPPDTDYSHCVGHYNILGVLVLRGMGGLIFGEGIIVGVKGVESELMHSDRRKCTNQPLFVFVRKSRRRCG